jgi:hypothetical protein
MSARGAEGDGAFGLDHLDTEGGGEVALAGARRTEKMQRLAAIDAEFGQGQDALAIERRLEGEVEAD